MSTTKNGGGTRGRSQFPTPTHAVWPGRSKKGGADTHLSGGAGGTFGGLTLFGTATSQERLDCNHSKALRGRGGVSLFGSLKAFLNSPFHYERFEDTQVAGSNPPLQITTKSGGNGGNSGGKWGGGSVPRFTEAHKFAGAASAQVACPSSFAIDVCWGGRARHTSPPPPRRWRERGSCIHWATRETAESKRSSPRGTPMQTTYHARGIRFCPPLFPHMGPASPILLFNRLLPNARHDFGDPAVLLMQNKPDPVPSRPRTSAGWMGRKRNRSIDRSVDGRQPCE